MDFHVVLVNQPYSQCLHDFDGLAKVPKSQFLITVHDTIASQVYDSMGEMQPGYLFMFLDII